MKLFHGQQEAKVTDWKGNRSDARDYEAQNRGVGELGRIKISSRSISRVQIPMTTNQEMAERIAHKREQRYSRCILKYLPTFYFFVFYIRTKCLELIYYLRTFSCIFTAFNTDFKSTCTRKVLQDNHEERYTTEVTMSRHKMIRSLDLDEELDDDYGYEDEEYGYENEASTEAGAEGVSYTVGF
jgi:hypothetical protein